MNNNIQFELKKLHYENFLWVIFIIIAILNIVGDYDEEQLLLTNNQSYEERANYIFFITIVVTIAIYFYFIRRNATAFKNAKEKEKEDYFIKFLGSAFLIAAAICLLYFQGKRTLFIGSPGI